MPASFTPNGDGTLTITFWFTANTQNITDAANDAAEALFKEGWFTQPDPNNPLTFNQLTNQQKLDLLEAWLRRGLLNLAGRRYIGNSVAAAEATATQDIATRYF